MPTSPELTDLFHDVVQSTINRLTNEPAAAKALAQKAQRCWDDEEKRIADFEARLAASEKLNAELQVELDRWMPKPTPPTTDMPS